MTNTALHPSHQLHALRARIAYVEALRALAERQMDVYNYTHDSATFEAAQTKFAEANDGEVALYADARVLTPDAHTLTQIEGYLKGADEITRTVLLLVRDGQPLPEAPETDDEDDRL